MLVTFVTRSSYSCINKRSNFMNVYKELFHWTEIIWLYHRALFFAVLLTFLFPLDAISHAVISLKFYIFHIILSWVVVLLNSCFGSNYFPSCWCIDRFPYQCSNINKSYSSKLYLRDPDLAATCCYWRINTALHGKYIFLFCLIFFKLDFFYCFFYLQCQFFF